MKAVCWHGARDVRVDNVPDPKILNPRDAIIKITSTAICGSDLHLYEGNIPTMKSGDILGHEFMGEVVELGSRVNNLKIGDRDACIDAVGMEAHGTDAMALYDKIKQAVRLETDRPYVLRQAIVACRKGGIVSVPGVYGGFIDEMPMGAIVNKGLTLRSGQTHVHKYLRLLLERIQNGEIDPSFVITHRLNIADAPKGYEIFKKKEDNCIKVVLKP